MCLPDTAEYWWDVKASPKRKKHVYVHKLGLECGHYHVFDSKKYKHIDCPACIKIMSESDEQYKSFVAEREYKKCSCGSMLITRTNKTTGEQFLGCSKFPTCKNTKPLKTISKCHTHY